MKRYELPYCKYAAFGEAQLISLQPTLIYLQPNKIVHINRSVSNPLHSLDKVQLTHSFSSFFGPAGYKGVGS